MKKLILLFALAAAFVACKEESPEKEGENTEQSNNNNNGNNNNNNGGNNNIDTTAPMAKILGTYNKCRIAKYDKDWNFHSYEDVFIGEIKANPSNSKEAQVLDTDGNVLWTLSNVRFVTKTEIAFDLASQSRSGFTFEGESAEPIPGTSSYVQGLYSIEHKEIGIKMKVSGKYLGYYRVGMENKQED